MQLFHFTTLLDLPAILHTGITEGEVPLGPYKCEGAANLTRNPNPASQNWASQGNPLNKTRVRLTVDLPEESVVRFVDAMKDRGVKSSFLKQIDPAYHRRDWFFAFAGVPPEAIAKIEWLNNGEYNELAGDELKEMVAKIEKEKAEKLDVISEHSTTYNRTIKKLRLKPGVSESWLLDGDSRAFRKQGS